MAPLALYFFYVFSLVPDCKVYIGVHSHLGANRYSLAYRHALLCNVSKNLAVYFSLNCNEYMMVLDYPEYCSICFHQDDQHGYDVPPSHSKPLYDYTSDNDVHQPQSCHTKLLDGYELAHFFGQEGVLDFAFLDNLSYRD